MARRTPLVVLGLAAGLLIAAAGLRSAPQEISDLEHFKYGSTGAEGQEGLPYWVWQALPQVCGDRLEGRGYAALGFVWEPGRELPIGFSKRSVWGGDRIAINCAFCHTATYRATPADRPQIVVGGPSTRTTPQGFFSFVRDCVASDRFTSERVLAAIDRMTTLSFGERLALRAVVIPATRHGVAKRAAALAWSTRQPPWGPGRVDPFNPVKVGLLGMSPDGSVGASDMMPLWDMGSRDGQPMHWDGVNPTLHSLMLSSGLANGASPSSMDLQSLGRMERWVRDVPAARYPFTVAASTERGAAVFARDCAGCHGEQSARRGQVVPIEEIGTDRFRLDSFTQATADGLNRLGAGSASHVTGFRKSGGYVAVPLNGIWLRAPYLHNGSVPTLAALLSPPAERPARFFRGYDVFDPVAVGFVSSGPEAEREGFLFDTTLPGNGNGGHLYGTTLDAGDRAALIEFLKTL